MPGIEEKTNVYRERQFDPELCDKNTYGMLKFGKKPNVKRMQVRCQLKECTKGKKVKGNICPYETQSNLYYKEFYTLEKGKLKEK